jgi:hyperosmotically inducible periplasmic protein
MKLSFEWKVLVPSAVLSFGLALPVLAQSDNGATAGQSMNAAGESVEQAGSDTAKAAEQTYDGTATAVRDTKITLKVKTALHADSATEHSEIHVSTSAGIVTLKGEVNSTDVAARAEQLALNTEGVKEVNNQLKVPGATMPD